MGHDSLGHDNERSTRVHDQSELPTVDKGSDESRDEDGEVKDD